MVGKIERTVQDNGKQPTSGGDAPASVTNNRGASVGLGGQAPRSKEPVVAVIYIKNRYFNEVNQLVVVIPALGTYANVLFVDKKWADRISRYVLEHDADGIVKITASKLLEMIKTSEDWSEDTDAINLVSLLEQAIKK